jgi:hypothetical protein
MFQKQNKSHNLDERKKYAVYIGDQEMDTVKFQYKFLYGHSHQPIKTQWVYHSDNKLSAKEAWAKGKSISRERRFGSPLHKVTEVIIVKGELENPDANQLGED